MVTFKGPMHTHNIADHLQNRTVLQIINVYSIFSPCKFMLQCRVKTVCDFILAVSLYVCRVMYCNRLLWNYKALALTTWWMWNFQGSKWSLWWTVVIMKWNSEYEMTTFWVHVIHILIKHLQAIRSKFIRIIVGNPVGFFCISTVVDMQINKSKLSALCVTLLQVI